MDDIPEAVGEHVDAAALVARWRQLTAQGKSFKTRWTGEPFGGVLEPGDIVEMVGPTAFELRKGDVISFQRGNVLVMRRILRFVFTDGRNAYVVRDAQNQEEAILHSQIVGKVVVVERLHHRHVLDRAWEKKRRTLSGEAESLEARAQRHVDSFHFWLDRVRERFGRK